MKIEYIMSIILEIVLGQRKRGVSFEKCTKNREEFMRNCRFLGEDEMIVKYFPYDDDCTTIVEKQKQSEDEMNSHEMLKDKKGNRTMNSKLKQKAQQLVKSNENEKFESFEDDGFDKSSCSASVSTPAIEQNSGMNNEEGKFNLPISIRLYAARVYCSLGNCVMLCGFPKRMMALLSEGLEMPKGAEEEYLSQKKKELKDEVLTIKEDCAQASVKGKGKRKGAFSSSNKNKIEKAEKEKRNDENENVNKYDADSVVIANIESYYSCRRSIPLTPCDFSDEMKRVQKVLLLTSNYLDEYYKTKAGFYFQPVPDQSVITLMERLTRLMNFPLKRFCTLAGSCIETLYTVMSDSMLFRYLPSIEDQIMADLPLIEKEMAEAKLRDKLQPSNSSELSYDSREEDAERLRRCFVSKDSEICFNRL
eukprot:MONOS_6838.1-p1 / transcript=MONOS_6838.1 / gene=MONOS_6838 / organism=Monocercomonoides_exilis_PA203 / gene_product=unspecified product / transcript_product=unspecified product / location=Mono_scaffold00223:46460-48087(+) / protein_length=420 / sequence_SO=supercontig / SO=protein_coding / is_pseudo=false